MRIILLLYIYIIVIFYAHTKSLFVILSFVTIVTQRLYAPEEETPLLLTETPAISIRKIRFASCKR